MQPPILPHRTGGGRAAAPVVLVTGASSGIGAAVASRLSGAGGYDLLLNGRDTGRLSEVARRTGGLALPGDLTAWDAADDLADRAVEAAGRVDVVIACAGIGWWGPFATMPSQDIAEMTAVNFLAPVRLVRSLLPGMTRRGSGHVVLLDSIAGAVGVGGEAVYSATKAALRGFADALRYEVADAGVRVSVVLPAAVDTPFLARRRTPYTRGCPRVVAPQRVAEAVHRLVRDPRDEVHVPHWMRLPIAVHGAVPSLYRALARRFG